jgi:hypothetical protein
MKQRLELIIGLEIDCDLWNSRGETNVKELTNKTLVFAQRKIAELQRQNPDGVSYSNSFTEYDYGEGL